MFKLPDWPSCPPPWEGETLKILQKSTVNAPQTTGLKEIISNSDKFPIKFPIDSARCKTLYQTVSKEELEHHINSVYPVLHEYALLLYASFLLFKKKNGSSVERRLYDKMDLPQFVQRLLDKRAVMFMGKYDKYILINGSKGSGRWESIGTDNETAPLVLENCLSYDEIKLSALLSVSSYSYFINDGKRKNMGKPSADRSNIEKEGIVVGIIGTRLPKNGVMEYQEIVISKSQNTLSNGYGNPSAENLHNLFSTFYQENSLTFDSVSQNARFVKVDTEFFDNVMYAKRLGLSFDTLLTEANHRAKIKGVMAYVHVVGIGLGVWSVSLHQEQVFLETFVQRICSLGSSLSSISDIHFAYFHSSSCGKYKNGDIIPVEGHPCGGIRVFISKREPFTKLTGSHQGKLLVASYAWDGNALPGNEFWQGSLGSTGDSSTASSTQISEIHNPHINRLVGVESLKVATKMGLLTFNEYVEKYRKK